jgi:hypothetical protein
MATSMVRRVCVMAMAGGMMLLGAVPMGWAQGGAKGALGALEEGALERLEVVAVQPVIYADSAAASEIGGAMSRVAMLEADSARAARMLRSAPMLAPVMVGQEQAADGLGFAGQSDAQDIETLRVGYTLGMLPLMRATDNNRYKVAVAQLANMPRVQGLSEGVQKAVDTFVFAAQRGEVDQAAYMAMMEQAMLSIAGSEDASVQRRHGYLLVGLWSGLAMLEAEGGVVSARLIESGKTLVRLLEQDAAHGGSDLALAATLKAMIEELGQQAPSADALAVQAARLLKTRSDV